MENLYSPQQAEALALFLRQRTTQEIADFLEISVRTVQQWISRFEWKKLRDDSPIELVLRQRIAYLMWLDIKHDAQLKELDQLLEQHRKNEAKKAKSQRFSGGADEGNDRTYSGKKRGRPSNKLKNDISNITADVLREFRERTFFQYQLDCWAHKNDDKINDFRFYLKSRQIGLTYYFAFEAFEDAVLNGDNQVFLSASKKQSEIFKNYIIKFALELGEVELKGKDQIVLSNGAEINFLSTNASTSQGFNGHVYFDEVFWIPKFKLLDDYAGGMSIQSHYRTTYLSTPSTTAHEAYPKWAGDKALAIDISHKALKSGMLGPDGIFRQIITIDDAIEGGATFFNLEKLKKKYPDKTVFNNLLRCVFLDDSASFFSFKSLLACKTDTAKWRDLDLSHLRPVGDAEVLVGYDPRGGGNGEGSDDAGLIIALKPKQHGGVFRLIEKQRLKGHSYEAQAQAIKDVCQRYNVVYLAIDTSGVGSAVAELVSKFYPALTELDYSPELKRLMAYKSREIINSGRLQFSDDWDDLVHSFLMIRQHTTKASNQITFIANRSTAGSHADLAWACMHVLRFEPIDTSVDANRSTFSIY